MFEFWLPMILLFAAATAAAIIARRRRDRCHRDQRCDGCEDHEQDDDYGSAVFHVFMTVTSSISRLLHRSCEYTGRIPLRHSEK